MHESVFTKIINGEIPCHKVYEDDSVIAFLDIHPQMPGHTLVVPKTQIDQLWDLDEDLYQNLWTKVHLIGSHMRKKLDVARIGVVVEGFGVPHVHVHLIPINKGEDLKKSQDLDAEPDHQGLAEMASILRI